MGEINGLRRLAPATPSRHNAPNSAQLPSKPLISNGNTGGVRNAPNSGTQNASKSSGFTTGSGCGKMKSRSDLTCREPRFRSSSVVAVLKPRIRGVLPTIARLDSSDRPSAASRGYDHNWHKVRSDFPRGPCTACGTPWQSGFHLDHIVSRSAGGTDEHHNLRWLCPSCHASKTNRVDGGFGNRTRR